MDEFACWQVHAEELSPEVRAGIRRAFAIARDRQSTSIEADDLVLGLLAVRVRVGIAWVGDWPVDVAAQIPGKDHSYGDALNWEALLHTGPSTEPLHFVADDRDYASPFDAEGFNEYLLKEWNSRKGGDIIPYRRLSDFFKSKFPHIKLAGEIEKDLLIQQLAVSPNFSTSHSIIARLRQQSGFTAAQANALISVGLNNDQVRLVINDEDIESFFRDLMKQHQAALDPAAAKQLELVIASHAGY